MPKSFDLSTPYSLVLSKSLQLWLTDSFYNSGAKTSVVGEVFSVQSYPGITGNKSWAGKKKNWSYRDSITIHFPSGVDNTYTINYRDGLVIFGENKASCSGSYSYNDISIIDSRDNDFIRGEAYKIEPYRGIYKENSLQLPCIAVEISNIYSEPHQVGSYSRDVNARVSMYTFASSIEQSDRITEVLHNQIDSVFELFNYETAYNSGDYPFNMDGTLQDSNSNYQYLTQNYPFLKSVGSKAYIYDAEIENMQKLSNGIYYNTVDYNIRSVLTMGL